MDKMIGPELVQVQVDGETAHRLSVAVLEVLEGENIDEATAGLALTLGRIMRDPAESCSTQEEIDFVVYLLEHATMYLMKGNGRAN